jgi:hypothetical protein
MVGFLLRQPDLGRLHLRRAGKAAQVRHKVFGKTAQSVELATEKAARARSLAIFAVAIRHFRMPFPKTGLARRRISRNSTR